MDELMPRTVTADESVLDDLEGVLEAVDAAMTSLDAIAVDTDLSGEAAAAQIAAIVERFSRPSEPEPSGTA